MTPNNSDIKMPTMLSANTVNNILNYIVLITNNKSFFSETVQNGTVGLLSDHLFHFYLVM